MIEIGENKWWRFVDRKRIDGRLNLDRAEKE